jgi:hypothetical protein
VEGYQKPAHGPSKNQTENSRFTPDDSPRPGDRHIAISDRPFTPVPIEELNAAIGHWLRDLREGATFRKLNGSDFRLLTTLASTADPGLLHTDRRLVSTVRSHRELSIRAHVAISAVYPAIIALQDKGLLIFQEGKGHGQNLYELPFKSAPPPVPQQKSSVPAENSEPDLFEGAEESTTKRAQSRNYISTPARALDRESSASAENPPHPPLPPSHTLPLSPPVNTKSKHDDDDDVREHLERLGMGNDRIVALVNRGVATGRILEMEQITARQGDKVRNAAGYIFTALMSNPNRTANLRRPRAPATDGEVPDFTKRTKRFGGKQ